MKSRALLAIALANLLGGLSYLWQKLAAEGLPHATVAAGRTVVGCACLLAWMLLARRRLVRPAPADVGRMALAGIFAYGLPLLLGIVGTAWATASNGSILILLEPAAILIFARLLLGERIRRPQAWGVGVGLVGALCIVSEQASFEDLVAGEYFGGNLVLMLHGILWGLYTPLVKPLATRLPALELTLGIMGMSLLLLGPAAVWELSDFTAVAATSSALLWVLVLGIAVSFASTLLWTYSLRDLPSGVIAAAVFIQPLTGVLAGSLVLGEALSGYGVLGSSLISLGVLAVLWGPRQPAACP